MADLDEAKRIALEGQQPGTEKIVIKIMPAISTTPMNALRYDDDIKVWVMQTLP